MTQQAMEWQPVWAKCCSGKTEAFSLAPSGNQIPNCLMKNGYISVLRLHGTLVRG